MSKTIKNILQHETFSKEMLVELLKADTNESQLIFEKAALVKAENIGNKVHLRGLIELSNICMKNCFYCGIRRGNAKIERYAVSDKEVVQAIRFAMDKQLGSIVIQSGELVNEQFVSRVEKIVRKIKKMSNAKLGVTLSCGEQNTEIYHRWFEAGAHRYLLRIETSNRELYYKIHPRDQVHDYDQRLEALKNLRQIGFQVGTGVMIGLPFQTIEDLADDLLFMKKMDIDMCGMGPYVEHENTPLYQFKNLLLPKTDRVELSLKMIALLRIIMKDINIASTTALQSLATNGRERALQAGANILMPNITPGIYRNNYALYQNKPGTNEEAEDSHLKLEQLVERAGCQVAYAEWGDSRHFQKKGIN